MERFIKGDIVVVSFPFSDLSHSKRRPALAIQHFNGEDLLLAQITSQNVKDEFAIPLDRNDFKDGALKQTSNIRPNKLFTCSVDLIIYKIGTLKKTKMNQIIQSIKEILDR